MFDLKRLVHGDFQEGVLTGIIIGTIGLICVWAEVKLLIPKKG